MMFPSMYDMVKARRKCREQKEDETQLRKVEKKKKGFDKLQVIILPINCTLCRKIAHSGLNWGVNKSNVLTLEASCNQALVCAYSSLSSSMRIR